MDNNTPPITALDREAAALPTRHERRWRERRWQHFSMTRRGRMSWADWFTVKRHASASDVVGEPRA